MYFSSFAFLQTHKNSEQYNNSYYEYKKYVHLAKVLLNFLTNVQKNNETIK